MVTIYFEILHVQFYANPLRQFLPFLNLVNYHNFWINGTNTILVLWLVQKIVYIRWSPELIQKALAEGLKFNPIDTTIRPWTALKTALDESKTYM